MSARRRIPGIAYVIAGVTVALLIALIAPELVRHRELEGRAAAADSTARARLLEATILRRDARAAQLRADSSEHRADSLATIADSRRVDVAATVQRAAASSALVDFSTLPPDVLQALVDADDLRIAVTPMLAADSAAIAGYQVTVRQLQATIALQDSAYRAQAAALGAREDELRALEHQAHPRCGRRCGIALGAVAALAVRELPRVARWLVSPPHP